VRFPNERGLAVRALRFLAFAPLALGLVVLFFALVWTEWSWLLYVLGLFALAAGIWRIISGRWAFGEQRGS
jgi:hypothetical protein